MTAWLDRFSWWANLPYPTKGALIRAIKAGLATSVGILLALATSGLLLPPAAPAVIVIATTMILQSLDKFLRETNLEKEANADPVIADPVEEPVEEPVVPVEPVEDPQVPDGV
jgi:hypothetical protein